MTITSHMQIKIAFKTLHIIPILRGYLPISNPNDFLLFTKIK